MMIDTPVTMKIVAKNEESPDIFTLTLQFMEEKQTDYDFQPGQFNMLYLFGVGEVPISILAHGEANTLYAHTIRRVGRVTQGLSLLKVGDCVGLRGPFGRGWPLDKAQGKDVLIVTGGLGCAPSVSIIHHILKHRSLYGSLIILQGVKHSDDLIFKKQYNEWAQLPDVQVALAADISQPNWPGHTGLITELLDQVHLDLHQTICMMCGPEGMMRATAERLTHLQLPEEAIYLSLERNMECAIGHCGHCQFGGTFICKEGPVFNYAEVKFLLTQRGF